MASSDYEARLDGISALYHLSRSHSSYSILAFITGKKFTIMNSLKLTAIVLAALVGGAFVASQELRAYAANTVFSTDIVD